MLEVREVSPMNAKKSMIEMICGTISF